MGYKTDYTNSDYTNTYTYYIVYQYRPHFPNEIPLS